MIDRPTPLFTELEWLHPLNTHAPEGRRTGWRFTARSRVDDAVRTFDADGNETGWRLCNFKD